MPRGGRRRGHRRRLGRVRRCAGRRAGRDLGALCARAVRRGEREARRRVQDAANNALLLQRLQGQADRRAYFVSTLVAVRHADDPQPLVAVGRWPGGSWRRRGARAVSATTP